MKTHCYHCAMPVDSESDTAIHVRERDGTHVHCVVVRGAEYVCYDEAQASIERDGDIR